MYERKVIKVWVMEGDDPNKSILDLLTDFKNENEINLLVFNDENSLYDQLIQNGPNNSNTHNMVLFNFDGPLKDIINVIGKIKSHFDLKMIPIFIITSSVISSEIFEAYKCYLNCYIVRPDDFEGLIKILNSFKEFWFNIVRLP